MASPINNTYAQTQTVINTPGGGNTMVQYNKNGTFAGDNGFKYDSKLQSMSILGNINIGGWVKGKIYTNKYNFFLTGGNSGQVLSTDGTGNLSWVDQTGGGGGSNYGNSNVASYLPTYTGNIGAGNVKTNNLLYANGVAWNFSGTYSNSNVANYLPTYTGNITGGNVTVTGQLRGNTVYVTSTGTAINASQGNILTNEVTGTKLNLMSGLYTASVTSGATSNYSLTLPTTAGTNGQVLTTDGSGGLSWTTTSGGNPFDQELNTTDNVQFANITSTEAIKFSNSGNIVGALGYAPTYVSIEGYGSNSVNITANDIYTWSFDSTGKLTSPNDVVQNASGSVTCNAGAPTVIYTATSSGKSTLKLLIQVEGIEVLGQQWDTQSCEMVVARGLRNNNVVGSVYGLAYTSASPLATFNAIWNISTSRIEITCTPTSLTFGVEARVTVTEMITSA
jgi:hypothetical protein